MTANKVVVDRAYYRAKTAVVDTGMTVLVLTPGGRVDRGAFIEHVIVEGSEPWQPGLTYIVAMVWKAALKAWQPTAFYESVFAVAADGSLTATGKGPVAREASRLGRAAVIGKVRDAAKPLAADK